MTLRMLAVIILLTGTMLPADAAPPTIIAAPPGSGPIAQANTRVRKHRRSTVRSIRRTPAVQWEDAARIKRGDLFSTWSNAASN